MRAFSTRRLCSCTGIGAQLTGGRKVWLGAMRAVSDEMVLTLSAAGTADDVAARISALLKAGLKQAVLFPLAVDGDASDAILRTIEALS